MLNNLFLTQSEMHRLDIADCHDIAESVPAYKCLSQAGKTELFLSLMNYIGGQEINPFMEITLAEGVIRWKERRIMDDKLIKWVTPELINETYSRMRACIENMQKEEVNKTKLKAELELAKAKLAATPDFKWGSNDTVRDAQIAGAFPELVKKQQDSVLAVQKLHDEKEIIQLTLDQMNMTIDFFRVLNGSGE